MQRVAIMVSVVMFLFVGCQADEAVGTAVSSQDLIGTTVINEEGQPLGEMNQLILDQDNPEIAYGVIQLAEVPLGFKGVGFVQDYVAVPWSQLNFDEEQQKIVLAQSAEALLADAPKVNDLDEIMQIGWDTAVQTYWNK